MSDFSCVSCRSSKAPCLCQNCNAFLCKKCVQTLDSDAFSFLKELPVELSYRSYCGQCFDEFVQPKLNEVEEALDRAKQVLVYFTTQRKSIPLIKRSKEALRVDDCADRDETILRLGFFAAQQKFNAIVDVDVVAEKFREGKGSYQTVRWRGVGYGAQVDARRQDQQDQQDQVYR